MNTGQKNQQGQTASDLAALAGFTDLAARLDCRRQGLFEDEFADPCHLHEHNQSDDDDDLVLPNLVETTKALNGSATHIVYLSPEHDNPTAAVQPGPLRMFQVRSSVVGLEPTVQTIMAANKFRYFTNKSHDSKHETSPTERDTKLPLISKCTTNNIAYNN